MQKNSATLRRTRVSLGGAPIVGRRTRNEVSVLSQLSPAAITSRLEGAVLMKRLAAIYSDVLDTQVSARQAVYALYAQVSGTLTLLPFSFSLGWRALFFLLFVLAARKAFEHL